MRFLPRRAAGGAAADPASCLGLLRGHGPGHGHGHGRRCQPTGPAADSGAGRSGSGLSVCFCGREATGHFVGRSWKFLLLERAYFFSIFSVKFKLDFRLSCLSVSVGLKRVNSCEVVLSVRFPGKLTLW